MPSDCAQLGEAKPKEMPDAGRHGVLIETGGQTHGIAETAAKQGLLQAQIGPLQLGTQARQRGVQQRPLAPQ